jgi:hypothetical protein
MNVLTYTSLFPNAEMPEHGIFVARRMTAFAEVTSHRLEVVAPVPYFPSFIPAPVRWKSWARVPREEVREGVRVHHPRYLNPPVVGMEYYGRLMAAGTEAMVTKLLRGPFPFDVIDAHFVYPDGYAALKIAAKLKRTCTATTNFRTSSRCFKRRLNRPHVSSPCRKNCGRI